MAGNANSGGRNKKSLAEHALTGTGRRDRGTTPPAGAGLPPEPPAGRPPRPRALAGRARAEWTRMVQRLEASHTISPVDDAALYQYCCLFAETEAIAGARGRNDKLNGRLQIAIRRLQHDDLVRAIESIVQLKKLEAKYTTALRQGHMAIRQYLVEFGMTPAARTRVQPAGDTTPVTNPVDRFTKPRLVAAS